MPTITVEAPTRGLFGAPITPLQVPLGGAIIHNDVEADRTIIRGRDGTSKHFSTGQPLTGVPIWIGQWGNYQQDHSPFCITSSDAYYSDAAGWTALSLSLGATESYPASVDFIQNMLVFCNPEIPLYQYGNGGAALVTGHAGYTSQGFHKARIVREFGNALVLLGTWEDNTEIPTRIRTSDIGDYEGWVEGTTGSNFFEIASSPEGITGAAKIGTDTMFISNRNQLFGMRFIGTYPFYEFYKAPGAQQYGAIAPATMLSYKGLIYFLSEDGPMVYNGFEMQEMDGLETVRDEMMGDLHFPFSDRAHAVFDPGDRYYYLWIPKSDNTFQCWVSDVRRGAWWKYSWSATAAGIVESSAGTRWDEVGVAWNDASVAAATWASYRAASTSKRLAWTSRASASTGEVFLKDSAQTQDDGTNFTRQWRSGALGGDGEGWNLLKRFTQLHIRAKGTAVDVTISFDMGTTMETKEETLTLTSTYALWTIDLNQEAHAVVVDFQGTSDWDVERFSLEFELIEEDDLR